MKVHVYGLLAAFTLLADSGCEQAPAPPQITPADGRPDLPPAVLLEVEALDPKIDSDGDGLADVDELSGWTIRVDETGRPQGILERSVVSDPDMADTDGDGLLDGVERMVGSDPDSTDTDGDGLSDFDEVQRWGTSPASVDSDGDSRGQFPDPSSAPDAKLFDGAELALTVDPLDPSSAKIAGPLASNPLQGDSDGDGVWDGAENATPTRSSTIADAPRIRVGVNPRSRAGFYLNLTITEETTRSEEKGTEFAFGEGLSTTQSTSTEMLLATWFDSKSRTGVALDIGVNTEQAGADAGLALEHQTGIGVEATVATLIAAEVTATASTSQILSEVEALGETRTQTIEGGRITILADVENFSRVPCKLTNLSIQLGRFDPQIGRLRPVAQLRPIVGADDELVLGAGKVVAVQFEARDVDAGRMLALMANPGLMVLAPANFDVLTAGDEDYDFIEADVADRTAHLVLDFAPDDVRVVDVAAQVGRDPAGNPTGVSIAEVLDRLGVTYDADPIPDDEALVLQRYVFKIGDRVTELYTDAAPSLNDPLPYPPGREPGPRLLKRGWYTLIEHRNGTYSFDEQLFAAHLLPGDRATLMFMEDNDRDGLSRAEERLRGTSDDAIDSDGDGLSDWWEAKVGWQVAVEGQPPRATFSNPATKDTDRDGVDDHAELLAGTHPWVVDTDGDRVSDKAERDAGTNPLHYDSTPPTIRDCGQLTGDAFVRTLQFAVTDPDNDLVEVVVRWRDAPAMRIPVVASGSWSANLVQSHSVALIHATDSRGLVTELSCVPCSDNPTPPCSP